MTDNKQTRGRQRIDTSKRRESEEDRLITFSKRRVGLYKKASELCTLCGTELAILIFSPSGKPFSFAHPDETKDIMDACLQNRINELNERLTQLSIEVESEKERGRKLAQMARTPQNKPLCNQNINELGDDDAQRLKAWLLELQVRINNRLEELVANSTHFACSPTTDPLHPNVFSLSNDYEGLHPNVASSSYDYEGMNF